MGNGMYVKYRGHFSYRVSGGYLMGRSANEVCWGRVDKLLGKVKRADYEKSPPARYA